MRLNRIGLILSVLATATVLACSSSGGDGTSSAPGGSSPATVGGSSSAPAADKAPITVGVPVAATGVTGEALKGGLSVATAWGKWVNASGGIAGHPVDVIAVDDGPDGTRALSVVKDLVENKKVDAIVNLDSNESVYLDYLNKSGVPTIGGLLYSPQWYDKASTALFADSSDQTDNYAGAIRQAKGAGGKVFGGVVCAEVPVCAEANKVYTSLVPPSGLEYGGLLTVSASSPSYTSQCISMKSKNWDFIKLSVATATGIKVIQECALQGYTPNWMAAPLQITDASLKVDIPGIYASGTGFAYYADSDATNNFRDVMDQYAPNEDWKSVYATHVWQSLELLHKAMATVGDTISRETVMTQLSTIDNETLDGLLPEPITWAKDSHNTSLKCVFDFQIKDKKFEDPAGSLKPDCP